MATETQPVTRKHVNRKRIQKKVSIFAKLIHSLRNSEYQLIRFMVKQGVWQGDIPPQPAQYQKGSAIDFGIYLYWANNPSAVKQIANKDLDWVILAFLLILKLSGVRLPPTQLSDKNYKTLRRNKLIYTDGSVMSIEPFGMYDPKWLRTLINVAITILFDAQYNDGKFPTPSVPPVPIPLSGAKPSEVSLGLLSDWGAGTKEAASVMNGLTALQPDCLIHLGDIYYSGSPSTDKQLSFSYEHLGDVQNHFLALWPTDTYGGKSFTLNGNHEMYCGANGLFEEALTHPAFSSQQGVTYFALQAGDWTVLCLDSAYYGNAEELYMYGSIGKATDPQSTWIKSLTLNAAKVIVMTHHNAFDPNLDPTQQINYRPFWKSIKQALGGDPYAWYWGHVHNAIVYQSPIRITSVDNNRKHHFTTNTYCRCIGHGSMPYGATDALKPFTRIDNPYAWCAQYVSNLTPDDLPNGSTILTFALDDQNIVSQITEKYYLVNKPNEPAFINTLFDRAT